MICNALFVRYILLREGDLEKKQTHLVRIIFSYYLNKKKKKQTTLKQIRSAELNPTMTYTECGDAALTKISDTICVDILKTVQHM
jgi:hypothetical protein